MKIKTCRFDGDENKPGLSRLHPDPLQLEQWRAVTGNRTIIFIPHLVFCFSQTTCILTECKQLFGTNLFKTFPWAWMSVGFNIQRHSGMLAGNRLNESARESCFKKLSWYVKLHFANIMQQRCTERTKILVPTLCDVTVGTSWHHTQPGGRTNR